MSSRNIRRVQKELEEKKRRERIEQGQESESESEHDSPIAKRGPSMFAMLDAGGDEEDLEDDNEEHDQATKDAAAREADTTVTIKKKKKKKKHKAKAKDKTGETEEMDEIDRALKSLGTGQQKQPGDASETITDSNIVEFQALLSVDPQFLHVENEMRRLFGRAALENDDEGEAQGRPGNARERHLERMMRQQAGGSLAKLSLKRNIFVQGREDFPSQSSGGLGMELRRKFSDGTTLYEYVHSRAYQEVQQQFDLAQEAGDPQNMVTMMRFNPYHISTCLIVSRILKIQGQHAESTEILQRALFSLGRSVHSTFSRSLQAGTARLSFQVPANRELYLAGWRYLASLEMRSTWRTAYEWAKLLLAVNPEDDPYYVCLILDSIAIRAKQGKHWLRMAQHPVFAERWGLTNGSPSSNNYPKRATEPLPNVIFSIALAHAQAGDINTARESLMSAIKAQPWVAARLCKELNIEPIPKSIWGRMPRNQSEQLLTELYVTRAKDIWNTPESTGLLFEAASIVQREETTDGGEELSGNPENFDGISYDMTRHVLLTDKRELFELLPRAYVELYTSESDPLPPRKDHLPTAETYRLLGKYHVNLSEDDRNKAVHQVNARVSGLLSDGDEVFETAVKDMQRRLRHETTSSTGSFGLTDPMDEKSLEGIASNILLHLLGSRHPWSLVRGLTDGAKHFVRESTPELQSAPVTNEAVPTEHQNLYRLLIRSAAFTSKILTCYHDRSPDFYNPELIAVYDQLWDEVKQTAATRVPLDPEPGTIPIRVASCFMEGIGVPRHLETTAETRLPSQVKKREITRHVARVISAQAMAPDSVMQGLLEGVETVLGNFQIPDAQQFAEYTHALLCYAEWMMSFTSSVSTDARSEALKHCLRSAWRSWKTRDPKVPSELSSDDWLLVRYFELAKND